MVKKVEARKREHNRKQLNQRLSNLGYNLSLTEYKNPSVWHRQSWARPSHTWNWFDRVRLCAFSINSRAGSVYSSRDPELFSLLSIYRPRRGLFLKNIQVHSAFYYKKIIKIYEAEKPWQINIYIITKWPLPQSEKRNI